MHIVLPKIFILQYDTEFTYMLQTTMDDRQTKV